MNEVVLTQEQYESMLNDFILKELYKKRIDDAIEYIENNDLYYQDVDYDYEENMTLGLPSDEEAKDILLSILKGVDKE